MTPIEKSASDGYEWRTLLRRHGRWLVPLGIGAAGYVGFVLLATWISSEAATGAAGNGDRVLAGFLGVLALVASSVSAIFVVVGMIRTLAAWRRRRRRAAGKLTASERAARDRQSSFDQWWAAASTTRARLARHEVPSPVAVWDVVKRPGEIFFVDSTVGYARYYGQDVTYSQSSGFYFGHPLFVVAGLAFTSASNAARRSHAEAAARVQWREHQRVRLLVSNQRLVCNRGGEWLSFDYGAMTAVYPEIDRWSLICQFENAAPLLLHGPAVPTAAVITTLLTHGAEAVVRHPSLRALDP